MNVAVKICGIKTPEMAEFCASAGAQYVGIMTHPISPRYVDLDTAVLIATAAKKARIIPVAVFVDSDQNAIVNFCKLAQVDHVQLHGDMARQALPYLPASIHKIYATQINSAIPAILSSHDYLLFDSPNPGTGEIIDWAIINIPQNIKFFLAGGLNASNVKAAIKIAKPYAVDVASGVESSRGKKSESMILDFIKQVQDCD